IASFVGGQIRDRRTSKRGPRPPTISALLVESARPFVPLISSCCPVYNPGWSLPFGLPTRMLTMGFKLERVPIWTGDIAKKAGGMAAKLAPLAQAGANLEYIS